MKNRVLRVDGTDFDLATLEQNPLEAGTIVEVPGIRPTFTIKKAVASKGGGFFGGAPTMYKIELSMPGAKPRTITVPASEVRRNPLPVVFATIGQIASPITTALSGLLMGRELVKPKKRNPEQRGLAACPSCDSLTTVQASRRRVRCYDCGDLLAVLSDETTEFGTAASDRLRPSARGR